MTNLSSPKDYDPDVYAAEASKLAPSVALILGLIQPSPNNPRTDFPEDEHRAMVCSIKRVGVLEPIIVRAWPASLPFKGNMMPSYEIVAGERRWRAAKDAGLTVIPGMVRELTDAEVAEIQLIENLHREGLHPLDEAAGYRRLKEEFGKDADQIAEDIGKSRSYVFSTLKLTNLCADGQRLFRAGILDRSKALIIARIPTESLQLKAIKEITDPDYGGDVMSVRRAKHWIQDRYMLKLAQAPFPRGDEELVPTAGRCFDCPKRTGNQPELFEDVGSADVCTDPDCYSAKKLAHIARQEAEAKARGATVVSLEEAARIAPYGTQSNMAGHVRLDDSVWDGKNFRTYRELLGDQAEPILVPDERSAKLVEVVLKKGLTEKLRAAGVEKRTSSPANQDEANSKKETAYRQRLYEVVRDRFGESIRDGGAALEHAELAIVAGRFFERLEKEDRKRISRLWGAVGQDDEIIEATANYIPTMQPGELCQMLVDCALIGLTHTQHWNYKKEPAALIKMAELMKVDPAEIKKEFEIKPKSGKKAKSEAKAEESASAGSMNETAKVQPETASSDDGELRVGDRVIIATGLRGPNNHLRKCCGRTGVIEATTGAYYTVRFGPKAHEIVTDLVWNEIQKLPPAPEETPPPFDAAQAAEREAPAKKAARAAVKYAHPENPELCWTGRGRKPRWVEEWLKKDGNTLEMLEKGDIESDEKPTGPETPARCDKTLELPLGADQS